MLKVTLTPFAMAVWLAAAAVPAAATEYEIDPVHTDLIFRIKHMGISTVSGRFDKFTGKFDVDPKNIKATKGNAVIEVASVNTNNERRDKDLRSDNFFNTEKFAQIKFTGKSVKDVNEADSTCTLIGDLTIKDVTKEIALKIKGGGIINDGYGNERAAFTATGSINRSDYNLKYNKMVEAGRLVVGEKVELVLNFEGVHKLENKVGAVKEAGKVMANQPAKPEAKTQAKAEENPQPRRSGGGY